jgi:sulfur carrier protein ThiS
LNEDVPVPQVKLKIQNILIQKKDRKPAGFEIISVSANEGESVIALFRRLARENEDLNRIASYALAQDIDAPTAIILNGRFLGPGELAEAALKEGDELTILPLLDGG